MDEKTNEKKVVELSPVAAEQEIDSSIVRLSKTYRFEDQEISELDFSGLENLTVADMMKANKTLSSSGNFSVLPENDLQYAITLAVQVTGLPIEFFRQLAPRDGIRIKNKVTGFLFGGD